MEIINYETYKRKFGKKDKRSGEYHVNISEDIYNMMSQEKRFGIAFQNEIHLALMEDVLVEMNRCIMTDDKDNTLKVWKKIGEFIKKVLIKNVESEINLNDRYYEVAPSPDERTFFSENEIPEEVVINGKLTKNDITITTASGLSELGMFYRAMSTDVGESVARAIQEEKEKAIEDLYETKRKNESSLYYEKLNDLTSNWRMRISMYETCSSNLKFVNRSIENVRRK